MLQCPRGDESVGREMEGRDFVLLPSQREKQGVGPVGVQLSSSAAGLQPDT